MFSLTAIRKALKALTANETNCFKKTDHNLAIIGVQNNNLVLRHFSYGSGQKLKLTVKPLPCDGEGEQQKDRSSYFYKVSIKMLNRILMGISRVTSIKDVALYFPVSKNQTSPIIELRVGGFIFPLPVLFIDNAEVLEYDRFLTFESQFAAKLMFSKKVLEAASKQDVRYYLVGVALDIIDYGNERIAVNLLATDGHRMNMFRHENIDCRTSKSYIAQSQGKPIIIPSSVYSLVSSFTKDKIVFHVSEIGAAYHGMVFLAESDGIKLEFYARSIDAKYPDYKRITAQHEPFTIDLDISKIIAMLRYQSLYLIGLENERYPTTALDITVQDGKATIVFMPRTSTRDTGVKTKPTAKTLSNKEDVSDAEQFDCISPFLYGRLKELSPTHVFDCANGVSGRFSVTLNNNYLSDALSLFVGCNKMQMSVAGDCFVSEHCSSSIHFKNHTDEFTGEDGKITTLVMPTKV